MIAAAAVADVPAAGTELARSDDGLPKDLINTGAAAADDDDEEEEEEDATAPPPIEVTIFGESGARCC